MAPSVNISLFGGGLPTDAATLIRISPAQTLIMESQFVLSDPAVVPGGDTIFDSALYPSIGSCYVVLENVSPAGQSIRLGVAPSFVAGAVRGFRLPPVAPLSRIILPCFTPAGATPLLALADAAGALLDVCIWEVPR